MDQKLCSGGGNKHKNWLGGEIKVFHGNKKVDVIPHGFLDYEYCTFAWKTSQFHLKSTSVDGVCITSLSFNGKQLLVGKNDDQESFWINKDESKRKCLDNHMQTSSITIENGYIVESQCKHTTTLHDVEVVASCSSGLNTGVLSGEFKAVGNYNGRRIYEKPIQDANGNWWTMRFDNDTNRWIFWYSDSQIGPGEVFDGQIIQPLNAQGYHATSDVFHGVSGNFRT